MFDASAFGLSAVQFQAARMNSRGLGLDADVVVRTADFQIGNEAWKQQPAETADLIFYRRSTAERSEELRTRLT